MIVDGTGISTLAAAVGYGCPRTRRAPGSSCVGNTINRGARATALRRLAESRAQVLAAVAFVAIVAGFALHLAGAPEAGHQVWRAAVALLAVELAFEVGRTVIVDHHLGVDTIALVAMVGALALGEELAGAVIGLMFSGGAALEAAASRRARRELTLLVERAPRVAQLRIDGGIEEVSIDRVRVGDTVLVRTGEVVPVDGTVVSTEAVVDTSTLSGEPLPVTLRAGMAVMSGSANAGGPFDVRADRPAADSAYAALVRLVEQAQAQRAPFVRMADRYAGIFLPVTLLVAGLAWALSGDPVRGLAVVVVATPCPLILAAPIALVSGLSRAAQRGVIVKGAGAIETLGEARTVLFDKTGTLTVGTPEVRDIVALDGLAAGEILRLAASVDRLSAHVLGEALVRAAQDSALELQMPTDVDEDPGQGIAGTVDGHRVAVGSRAVPALAGLRARRRRRGVAGHRPRLRRGARARRRRRPSRRRDRHGRRAAPGRRAHRPAPARGGRAPRGDGHRATASRWPSASAACSASIASTPSSPPNRSSRSSGRSATTPRSAR